MMRDPNDATIRDALVGTFMGTAATATHQKGVPMAGIIERAAATSGRGIVQRRQLLLLLAAIVTFAAIAALRFSTTDTHAAIASLFVFPIVIIAIEFGVRAGASAGVVASVAFVAWHLRLEPSPLSTLDVTTQVVELLGIGVLVGWLAGARRRELAISHAVLNALPEPASVTSPSGRYLLVNPALKRLLAVSNEQHIGTSAGHGPSLDVARRIEEAERRVLATGRPVEFEVDSDIPGVGSMTTRTVKSPVLDARGQVIAIVTIAHDISERVAHEREMLGRATEARAEYERATGEYAQLLRHRLANPLTVIECASALLRTQYAADPAKRELLADLISDQVARLADIDLGAEQVGLEEHDLHGVPVADLEAIEETAHAFARSIRQPFDGRAGADASPSQT
jgi:PAS domain-containing protein